MADYRKKRWRTEMAVRVDVNGALDSLIGEGGLKANELASLDEVDPHRTVFNVISKSGATAETMSQFLIVRERLLKVLGAVDYNRRVVMTTDADAGALRQSVND